MAERIPDGSCALVHFRASSAGKALDDTRELLGEAHPFELRIGKQFAVPEFEVAVKRMRPKDVVRLNFDGQTAPPMVQLLSVLRGQSQTKSGGDDSDDVPIAKADGDHSRQSVDEEKLAQNGKHDNHHHHHHSHSHGHGHGHNHSHHGCAASFAANQQNIDLMQAMQNGIEVELELVDVKEPGSFERASWELSWEEKAAAVHRRKGEGNAAVGRNDFVTAAENYETALGLLDSIDLAVRTKEVESNDVLTTAATERVALLLNYSLCMLKQKRYASAIEHATVVLKNDRHNSKALFRRGQARLEQGRDIEEAHEDLEQAQRLNPSSTSIRKMLQRCQTAVAAAKKADKARYRGMFG